MSPRLKCLTLATLVLSLNSPLALTSNSLVVQDTLAQAATAQNRKAEADRLLQQGIKQLNVQQLDAALQSLQHALAIYKEIKDRPGQGQTLKYLGNVYFTKKDNAKAIEAYQQSLVIAREIKDRDLEGKSLLNLGIVYNSMKNYDQALEYLQPSWQIALEIKSRELQFMTLPQLIAIYSAKGDTAKVQEYKQQLITKFSELIKFGEAAGFINQLSAYNQQKNYQKAIEVGQQALEDIRSSKLSNEDAALLMRLSGKQIQDILPDVLKLLFEIQIIGQLLEAYDAISDYPKIIVVGQQALEIIHEFKVSENEWKSIASLSEGTQKITSLQEFKKSGEMGISSLLSKAYDISGEYEKAIPYAQQALRLARELKNPELEANALLTLASASESLTVSDAEYQKSLAFAQQALIIARQIKNLELESEALDKIASIYKDLEEYPKTIEFAEASLSIAKKSKSPAAVIKPLITLSITYLDLGKYQKSNQLAQEALAIAQKIKQNPIIEATSLVFVSLNQFIQGDYQKTITSAQEGLKIAQKINIPYHRQQFLMLNYVFLGIGYGGLNDYQKGIDSIQKTVEIARNSNNSQYEAQWLAVLGGFYRRNREYQQALDAYNRASDLAEKLKYSGEKVILYTGLARVYSNLNQQTTAITYYQKAINDLEKIQVKNRGLSKELQVSFLQAIQDADKTTNADIIREYANLLLSQGRTLEASQVLELLKVQELREFTNNRRVSSDNRPVTQNPIEAKIIKNYGSLIAFGQRVDECQKNNCPERAKLVDERDTLISEFSQTIQNLEKNVRDRLSKDRGNLDTQDLRSVGKKIVESQAGTVLINVFVVEDKTWLLWVSKGGVVKSVEVPLGEQKMRETVNKFRKLLQNPSSDIKEVKATGKQLYDWLIKPIEPELKANKIQNLVFSLDRAARYIPVGALFDGNQYLVENYNISTVLSAGLTDTDSRLPTGTANTQVLALGLSNAVPGFNALPNVPAELEGIVRQKPTDKNGIYPGETFLNQKFDYRALRDHLKNRQILHIATHGVFVPGRQDDSYLVLGTGEKLPIPKIDNLEDLSDVHLVVLSACETALGETAKDGIEIPGISFYFLNRRAKAVMASLWLVNDASTSILMQQFYSNLAKDAHTTKAQALRQAQLSLLGSNNSTPRNVDRRGINVEPIAGAIPRNVRNATGYSHPYYWAPFILIGNGL